MYTGVDDDDDDDEEVLEDELYMPGVLGSWPPSARLACYFQYAKKSVTCIGTSII